ncbi:MAG TPA: prepilin-type N-terminal cleavage/methylation domain-containing protein, partial [Candidatus Moranbacteria bacterium]|nr:prepilin-type N-terminal cleavage/methylation domain-containing protein [Candidatus Moranbacteria bacterium]
MFASMRAGRFGTVVDFCRNFRVSEFFMNKMREKRGFSLVETMVASLVVAIGLVALLELFAPALTDTKLARNQVVAASLAQEGVELARNR